MTVTVDLTSDQAFIASPPPRRAGLETLRRWFVEPHTDTTGDGPQTEKLVAAICSAAISTPQYARVAGIAVSRSAQAQYAGVIFTSGPTARELESLQETLGVGPGPSALREGALILVPDLAADPRAKAWVGFDETVAALDVASVYALPLQVGTSSVGLLTLHGHEAFALSADGLRGALQLADILAIALLTPQLIDVSVAGSKQYSELTKLLDAGHVVTHQAIGMVSVQLDGSVDDALAMLRAHAFSTDLALVDVARLVVAQELSFHDAKNGPDDSASAAEDPDTGKGDGDNADS